MSLLKLKEYLKEQQQATIAELTSYLQLPEAIITDMLELLIHKQLVEKQFKTPHCFKSCSQCHTDDVVLYRAK